MFLITSLKKTFHDFKKHKWLFLLLFFTQLLFIIVFILIQLKYQVAVVQNFKDILGPLENANYNVTSLQAGAPFLQDYAQVMQNWAQLKVNLQYLLLFSFLAFALLCGFNWSLTHYLIKKQPLLKLWGKFIAFSSLFFAPYILIIISIFQTALFQDNPTAAAQFIAVLAFVFVYFALLSFSLINLDFKEIFRKTFWQIGLKKFYWVLLIYLIVFALLALLFYLVFLAITGWPLTLVFILIILLILAINFGRIFIINSVSELN